MKFKKNIVCKLALFCFLQSILTACGGGGSGGSSNDFVSESSSENHLFFDSIINGRVIVEFGEVLSISHQVKESEGVIYRSTDHTIASVNSISGEVYINSPGIVTITADTEGASQASYELVVNEPEENILLFPGTVLNSTINDGPFYNWVIEPSGNDLDIIYRSSDSSVADVEYNTGKLTIVGTGEATITATLPATNTRLEQRSSYKVRVADEEEVESRNVIIEHENRRIKVVTTFSSGYTEVEDIWVGSPSQFGLCAEKDISTSATVLVRTQTTSDQRYFSWRCVVTDGHHPDMRRPLEQKEWDEVFNENTGFYPIYIAYPGAVIDFHDETYTGGPVERVTTVNYESGLVEATVFQAFREDQTPYDYNSDGDRDDYVTITEIYRDKRLLNRATSIGGEVAPVQFGNVPTRVVLPEDYPNFLKFHGDISRVKVHVRESDIEGQFYVKVDAIAPDIQLLIFHENSTKATEIRSDFFNRTVLHKHHDDVKYSIYILDGERFLSPLPHHPNFQQGYEVKGELILNLVKNALDENLNIIEAASIDEFTKYYKSLTMRYSPYTSPSHYSGGKVYLSGLQVYSSRVAIHEAAHGYHDNYLVDGFDNQDVKSLYDLVSHDTLVRYGDEDNAYWRTNESEFFAELLTTYIYLSADENDVFALSQVDSSFYYEYAKPYFDDLFMVNK